MENQQGISLLEVLIALLLLSISGIALLHQQININASLADLLQRNQSLLFIENTCQANQLNNIKYSVPEEAFRIIKLSNALLLLHTGRNKQTFTLKYPCPISRTPPSA